MNTNKMILATGILVSANAVSTQTQDIYDDIAKWFENDFVDFWEDDFVGAFEDLGEWFETDFVDFWEKDFVNFFTDDIPEFFTETLPDGLEKTGEIMFYFVTLGQSDAVVKWFENDVADAFEDIGDWFAGDFVDFFENDFVDFWEDDVAGVFEDIGEWFEDDFVDFWTADLPDFFIGIWHGIDTGDLRLKESENSHES